MNHGIIGHGRIRRFLRTIAEGKELPHHSFLFTGPEHIGKSLVAREFSALLLGVSPEDTDTDPDFRILRPERTSEDVEKDIPVDAVRDAVRFLSRFPSGASRRVLLVEEAHRMTDGAQNALLKTFEEPNDTSVLLLVTSRPGAVRETLRSRSFQVSFTLVPEAELLEGVGIEGTGAEAKTDRFFVSLGRPGIVFGSRFDPETFAQRRDTLRKLFRLSELTFSERIALAESLSSYPVSETLLLLEWWVSIRRTAERNRTDPDRIRATYRLLEEIEETARLLRTTNANTRIALDRLFLSVE